MQLKCSFQGSLKSTSFYRIPGGKGCDLPCMHEHVTVRTTPIGCRKLDISVSWRALCTSMLALRAAATTLLGPDLLELAWWVSSSTSSRDLYASCAPMV